MFKFYKYVKAQKDSLHVEKRIGAQASGLFYLGMALTISAGELVYAQTADIVYAISNVSVVSGDVSSTYVPEVIPVNSNQIWKAAVTTAATAAFAVDAGVKTQIDEAATFGTGVDGGQAAASAIWVYSFTSAASGYAYVIFPDPVNRQAG